MIPRFKPYIKRDLVSVPPFPLPDIPGDFRDGSFAHPMPPPDSKRDPMVYVEAICNACCELMKMFSEKNKLKFFKDKLSVPASSFNIVRIGRWIKKMPQDFRGNNPSIEWDRIVVDAENLEFEPWEIGTERLWEIVNQQVPLIHQRMTEIIKSQTPDNGFIPNKLPCYQTAYKE
jgi:uncharacterized protein with HEPN domain